nr:hypothetical protein [Tanacetum cinerariifolium]
FGASRDSGLWMYLGIAIRMAQDLGMQTLEGLRYEGRNGITPKLVNTDSNNGPAPALSERHLQQNQDMTSDEQEQRAVEREPGCAREPLDGNLPESVAEATLQCCQLPAVCQIQPGHQLSAPPLLVPYAHSFATSANIAETSRGKS